jgi:Sec-independent protein secretion pathway component TatC
MVPNVPTPPTHPDLYAPAETVDDGLARPVVAGVVATICFLAAAVLFSTLAACFVNKQHRRKLKRKPGRMHTGRYTEYYAHAAILTPLQLPSPPPVDEIPSLISCCCASFVCFLFPVFFPRRPAFVRDTLQEKHRVTVSSDCQPPRTAHPLEVAHIVLVQCHRGE